MVTPTRERSRMKRAASKKSGKMPAKKRNEMVAEMKKEDCIEESQQALTELLEDNHFHYYPDRKKFVETVLKDSKELQVIRLLDSMKEAYMELLGRFCKGKKMLQLQNSWFLLVNVYFDQHFPVDGMSSETATKLNSCWKSILEVAAERKCEVSLESQRIVIGTLSSAFFDIMSSKMKEIKVADQPNDHTAGKTHHGIYHESYVSLYRFCGFALSSVLENHQKKALQVASVTVELLNVLKCYEDEIVDVPEPLKDLANTQNFCIVTPTIIPYVQLLMKIITSAINEQQLQAHGHDMIKVAKKDIINNDELIDKFSKCVCGVVKSRCLKMMFDNVSVETVRSELSDVIFNARVNEFFKAKKELELESNKKACDCDQSLRDHLKTFSSMKGRHH